MSVCIDSPKEDAWKVLSNVTNVSLWVDPILSASCESKCQKGVGTIRVCKLKGNMNITERWLAWEEGEYFTYVADETRYFKSAKNKWSVQEENGKSLVTTESEVVLKGGVFGKLLEPLMYMISKKMGADSLVALKYLVENGFPYEGRVSKLPRAPIIC